MLFYSGMSRRAPCALKRQPVVMTQSGEAPRTIACTSKTPNSYDARALSSRASSCLLSSHAATIGDLSDTDRQFHTRGLCRLYLHCPLFPSRSHTNFDNKQKRTNDWKRNRTFSMPYPRQVLRETVYRDWHFCGGQVAWSEWCMKVSIRNQIRSVIGE